MLRSLNFIKIRKAMEVVTLLFLLGTAGYVHADCYPSDTAYTAIIQNVYHGVTSNNFRLTGSDQLPGFITRKQLCDRLTSHHNNGKKHWNGKNKPRLSWKWLHFVLSMSRCSHLHSRLQQHHWLAAMGWLP